MPTIATNHCLRAALACAFITAGTAAGAAELAIINAGFDSSITLAPGQWTAVGTGIRQAAPVPGWVVTGWDAGLTRPGNGWFNAPYAHGIYAYFGGTGGGAQSMQQQVGVVAEGAYSFAIDVGWRSGLSFGGYQIDLLAGDVVVASNLNGTPFTAADRGSFKRLSVDWTATAASGLVGQPLSLRLSAPSDASGWQTAFDNASLSFTAAAVPEPGMAGLALCGLLVVGWRLQRQGMRRG